MGGITFNKGLLADRLSETAGYKAGLALSVAELCDLLAGSQFVDLVHSNETQYVRLRSEEYEQLYYEILHRIGFTETLFNGDISGAYRFHKYRKLGKLDEYSVGQEIILRHWQLAMNKAQREGSKELDPGPMYEELVSALGHFGRELFREQVQLWELARKVSPQGPGRMISWNKALPLSTLFKGGGPSAEGGKFIDQRFIDYLSANQHQLGDIHWRKFEEMTAEFYSREGYRVELGPGVADGGVDVRVWKADASAAAAPLCIVQCKRQKDKVQQAIVKSLLADVQWEGADYGVVVTTSEVAPGARAVISTRGYPIEEVDREKLGEWLKKLRTPGVGIVRR